MRYILLLTTIIIFWGCKNPKKLILEAEINGFHNNETIRLYSDSTYILKRKYEFDSINNKILEGKYRLVDDKLFCFGDFDFNGTIKNNFIESNKEFMKYEIINSQISLKPKIDFKKFPTYTAFTFNKIKGAYHFEENSIPYDLTENDLLKIDSILPHCLNKTKYFEGMKHANNYSKQCIATLNEKGEVQVWVNCACSGIAKNLFKYYTSNTNDGGHCYFKLKVNLNTLECFDVFVNGY
ncbi:hypothetical protein ACFS5J_09665 [Flavobacterium chuncheonense]|uniref:Lipoprotein n=1 Tax=Flavobacterium chuncheonense TaxID=2026653 RepID=A0ABW5YMJ0_9FLAO